MAFPENKPQVAENSRTVYSHEDGRRIIDLVYFLPTTEKPWLVYSHENGTRLLEENHFKPAAEILKPVRAAWGLSPEAVARGVSARRDEDGIRVSHFFNAIAMNLDIPLEDGTPLH